MDSIFSINQDSFIYSVRQAFEARSKGKGEFNSHLRYPPFLEKTCQKPHDTTLADIKSPLIDILEHHFRAIPHYARQEKVTLENISWFSHSTAALLADIEYLLQNTIESGLSDKTEETKELWDLLNTSIESVFKQYSPLFTKYTDWKYIPSLEQKETVDWNVRPPCGMLYRTEFKALFDELKNERFNKRNNKFDRNKGQGSDKNDKGNNKPDHANRPKNEKFNKNQKFDKKPQRVFEDDPALLKAALDECSQAIITLQKNKNIQEIPLSAQNSFIRRQQHTVITDAGFGSDSRGEGANRHVCIVRATQPTE